MDRSLAVLMREVVAYGRQPDKDDSPPVIFSDIASRFPSAPATNKNRIVWTAKFAEMGYCPYKSWHRGRGTPEKRTAKANAALASGEERHTEKEAADRAILNTLRKANLKQLRDASVNIGEVPEFPTRIRVGDLVYSSRVERAGRYRTNLTIMEMKSGCFFGGADHLLQTWGYCISAPGALSTGWEFAANGIQWRIYYPDAKTTFGPYTFSQRALSLVLEAMEHFERMFAAGRSNETTESFSVSSARCRGCVSFRQACVNPCRKN